MTTGSAGAAERAPRPWRRTFGSASPVSRRGFQTAGAAVARTLALFGVVVILGLLRTSMPPLVFVGAVGGALAGVYVAQPRDGAFRWWALYLGGFVLFALLRNVADETAIPWRFDYVIAAERALHLGVVPTVWLQERFYTVNEVRFYDTIAYAVYVSYFFVPHLVSVLIWRADRVHFRLFVATMLATFYGGLLASAVLPTAPPWVAGQAGHLPHVFKIKGYITEDVSPGLYEATYTLVAGNPVAAMPSLHLAITVVAALFMWRHHAVAGVAGAVYAAAMGLALVYLGEHYVVDLLAGVVLALAAWKVANRLLPQRVATVAAARAHSAPPH